MGAQGLNPGSRFPCRANDAAALHKIVRVGALCGWLPRLIPSRAGRRTARGIHVGPPIEFGHGAGLKIRDAAIGVAAQADNLHFVPDALTVVAAIFLFFGGKAGAGCIRAFPRISHSPPLLVPRRPSDQGKRKYYAEIDATDSSANSCARTSKIDRESLELRAKTSLRSGQLGSHSGNNLNPGTQVPGAGPGIAARIWDLS
jgi:hypothetical protein